MSSVPWDFIAWSTPLGLIAGATVVLYTRRVTKPLWEHLGRSSEGRQVRGLAPAAKWSFSDSWATDATAASTGAAAILLAVSESLEGTIDAKALVAFAVGNALLLAVAALAPLAYATLQRYHTGHGGPREWNDVPGPVVAESALADHGAHGDLQRFAESNGHLAGSAAGLFAAATLTLTAVFGALVLSAVLVQRGIPDVNRGVRIATWLAAFGLFAVISTYAQRTLGWLLLDANKHPDSHATLTGAVAVECCDDRRGAVRRTTLL